MAGSEVYYQAGGKGESVEQGPIFAT